MVSIKTLLSLKGFRDIPAQALEKLAEQMEEKVFPPEKIIIKEGEKTGCLFILLSGAVRVEKKTEKGEQKVVARLENQEFFGEMALLNDETHSASVIVQEESRILILPRKVLIELMQKDPTSALTPVISLFAGVSSRLKRTTQELVLLFEVAKKLGGNLSIRQLLSQVGELVKSQMGEDISAAFYEWIYFNSEYTLIQKSGVLTDTCPPVIDPQNVPLFQFLEGDLISIPELSGGSKIFGFSQGHLILVRIGVSGRPYGLMIFHSALPHSFDSGEKQMLETLSAVLAPAFQTAEFKEEEAARLKLERSKQQGYPIQ
ncbi:MAG: cyclic nucleotide-binding domain-containing protein [Elusimicrobiota bacterium]